MTAHRTHPPARAMRENPDLDQLKRQARELLEAYRAGAPEARLEVAAHHRTATPATFALHDAQFVLARSYGFQSWPKLKAAVDGVTVKKLHEAVEARDLGTARALLARRPEIVDLLREGPSGYEIRALHLAVMNRDVEMTRLLLEAGADTYGGIWPNRDATSPRTIAIERGYDDIVALIVEAESRRGARGPSSLRDARGRLERAMADGGESAVIALLEAEPGLAEITAPNGMTMLHVAVARGALAVAKWLVDHGADVNKRSHRDFWWPQGWTPLELVATGGDSDVLDEAAFERMAAFLLHRGALLSPVSAAALGRSDYFVDLSRESLEGRLVLQTAVRWNQRELLEQLLGKGLDPDERTQIGQLEDQTFSAGGPLLEAVNSGCRDLAEVLLSHGADPNAVVFTSGSPMYAAYHGGSPRLHAPDPAMIDLMLAHGGWIDATSVGYLRQVDVARRMLAGELDPHLESGSTGSSSPDTVAERILWSGASGASPEIVRMALERIDWPRHDPRWFWMLWRPLPGHEDLNEAEQVDCRETFRLILERCDPNLQTAGSGQTMLHEVVARDHNVGVALATLLLDAGASTDLRDNFLKSTPLGWACRWGREHLVRLLLDRGADPIEAGAEPWATPRAWATKMNRPGILALLDAAS